MRRLNINPIFLVIVVILAGESIMRGGSGSVMEWVLNKILLIPGIIVGLSFHEFGHAFTAYKLGDPTPKMQERVTINPMAHIDWIGLAALFFCGFGWGVPVEINPYNFKHRRRDEFLVAIAGVVMNLIVAIVFSVIAKLLVVAAGSEWLMGDRLGNAIWMIVLYTIQINLVLMIFNLIPCPPLDGFNILAQIGKFGQTEWYWKLYQYGNFVLIFLIVFGVTGIVISPCVNFLMNIIWGIIF